MSNFISIEITKNSTILHVKFYFVPLILINQMLTRLICHLLAISSQEKQRLTELFALF